MRRQEAVAALEQRLAPIIAGVERQHEATLLQRPVQLHIGVVIDRRVAHGRDHEAADMLAIAERFDLAQRCFGIAERQAQHREEALVGMRQHILGEPAIVGPAQFDLDLLLRMHADGEHAGREQAGVIDAHGVHPAVAELHVAQLAVLGLLRAAQRIAGDAAADILEADVLDHEVVAALAHALHAELPDHVVFHIRKELSEVLVLVMVRIDVDDQHIVELALVCLLSCVSEQPAGVELFKRNPASAVGDQIHGVSPRGSALFICRTAAHRPVQLCHMPSSKTARSAARRRPLAVTMMPVGLTTCPSSTGVSREPASIRDA